MPTSERLQVADYLTNLIIGFVTTTLNAGSELALYTADTEAEPDDTASALTEASYPGYARKTLDDLWQGPFKDEPGVYTTQTQIYEFPPPSSGGDVTVYGWMVLHDGNLAFSLDLETPVVLTVGGEPYRLRVYYSQYSGLIHAERVCS